MSTTTISRTIVVTGATGNQGKGTIRALLASGENWHIRALVRDLTSPWAKALRDEYSYDVEAGRLSFVKGNAYDPSSLRSAFAGAYGVFAVTWESATGRVLVEEAEMAHEIEAGRNIVFASKEAGVKHFVFSSLPDMDHTTNGQFLGIHHMNNKHAIEKIAKDHLTGVTCLIPGQSFLKTQYGTLADFVFSLRRLLLYKSEMASLQSPST
jgi:nucleoside-diphosphate-sugar epimerase